MKLNWPFSPAKYINRDDDLRQMVRALAAEPVIAIDTESNSLYAYRERVCLIQISSLSEDYIVDPLVIADMRPLGALVASPGIVKIFHAAEYDLICMKRDYGFSFVNLFDTMIAARICGQKAVGLGNLLMKYAGIEVDKRHQRDDWGKRPLPADSLLYAQMDTHYLFMLRDRLSEELTASDRWTEAGEAFEDLCRIEPTEFEFDTQGYWRIGLPHALDRHAMAVLRELYLLREETAEQRDLPPFKVFSDRTLVAIAQTRPRTPGELAEIEGMSPAQIRRYGKRVLEAVERANKDLLPAPPQRQPQTDPDVLECYTILREWRRDRARKRGVESDVIISKDALWSLARRKPISLDQMQEIPGLGPWRIEAYGSEIIRVIQTCNGHR